MSIRSSTNDLDSPLWGAKEIAPVIHRSPRQVYQLLEGGLIPAKKVGKTWVTTRRQLLALSHAKPMSGIEGANPHSVPRSREWWRGEARRTRTDWSGLLRQRIKVLWWIRGGRPPLSEWIRSNDIER